MEVKSETMLTGYSEHEKSAYLGALAALATADREADDEELGHLREIAQAAGISSDEEQKILDAAKDTTGTHLKECLEILKQSDLRYSLLTDLIALAKVDESYSEEEKANIEKVASHLNVSNSQFSAINQFVSKAADNPQSPEELSNPDFLKSSGLQEKFSSAGLDLGSMGKSLLGFLGPILLGSLAGKALGGKKGGGLGGVAGGVLGGMLGGSNTGGMGLPGGLGSLISGLNKSRKNQNIGGMLGKIFQ